MEKKTIYPRVNKDLYEEFKLLADKLEISISSLFEEAMLLTLKEYDENSSNKINKKK